MQSSVLLLLVDVGRQVQVVEFSLSCVCLGQVVHAWKPFVGLNFPFGQAWHWLVVQLRSLPFVQMQASIVVEPVWSVCVFGGHIEQVVMTCSCFCCGVSCE